MIRHDAQNMGMAADEDIRTVTVYHRPHIQRIMSGIAADMGHQHLQSFAVEKLDKRAFETYLMRITVAIDAYQRLEGRKLMDEFDSAAEITGMPYLVHRLEKFTELAAEHSVGI